MFVIHSVLGLPLQTNYLHAIFKTTPFSAFLCFFPLQWTLQQQPVGVVTSDHVTKVGHFSFLYCWNYVKLFVCQCKDFFIILFSFPSRIFSSSSDMPTFQANAILSYFWWLLSMFHIRIKVSTTHMLV